MPTVTQDTVVERVTTLSPDVRELTLRAPETPVRFRPGQWVSLHLPVGERPPLVRAYTLARPEDPSGVLTLSFDRVPGGLGSTYLFERQVGDAVTIGGVLGNFALPEPLEADLVWVARYTGIVPFRCMLLSIGESAAPAPRPIGVRRPSAGRADLPPAVPRHGRRATRGSRPIPHFWSQRRSGRAPWATSWSCWSSVRPPGSRSCLWSAACGSSLAPYGNSFSSSASSAGLSASRTTIDWAWELGRLVAGTERLQRMEAGPADSGSAALERLRNVNASEAASARALPQDAMAVCTPTNAVPPPYL